MLFLYLNISYLYHYNESHMSIYLVIFQDNYFLKARNYHKIIDKFMIIMWNLLKGFVTEVT